MSEGKTLGEVYDDRNALAVAFARLVTDYHQKLRTRGLPTAMEYRACWSEPDADDADADEWAIVYCWLPTGQVSWHVPRDLVEDTGLPMKYAAWDGHDRTEKNDRLTRYANL